MKSNACNKDHKSSFPYLVYMLKRNRPATKKYVSSKG